MIKFYWILFFHVFKKLFGIIIPYNLFIFMLAKYINQC